MKRAPRLSWCLSFVLLAIPGSSAVLGVATPIGEEVRFRSGQVSLSGSLLLPEGRDPFPAVVMLVGSGEYSYRGSWMPEGFFWKDISALMLERGFAVLLFDKRGINESSGSWKKSSFFDRADDALAAVRFLGEREDIDASRIGLLGHSQGGWIAHLGASRAPDEVAFAITLAGPAVSVKEQVLDDYESEWRCKELEPEEIARRRHKAATRYDRWGRFGYLANIRDYDPAEALRRIRQPTLAVFAENDELVWPLKNRSLLEEAFADSGNSNLFIHALSGVEHGLRLAPRCADSAPNELAPDLAQALDDAAFHEAIDRYRSPRADETPPAGDQPP